MEVVIAVGLLLLGLAKVVDATAHLIEALAKLNKSLKK